LPRGRPGGAAHVAGPPWLAPGSSGEAEGAKRSTRPPTYTGGGRVHRERERGRGGFCHKAWKEMGGDFKGQERGQGWGQGPVHTRAAAGAGKAPDRGQSHTEGRSIGTLPGGFHRGQRAARGRAGAAQPAALSRKNGATVTKRQDSVTKRQGSVTNRGGSRRGRDRGRPTPSEDSVNPRGGSASKTVALGDAGAGAGQC